MAEQFLFLYLKVFLRKARKFRSKQLSDWLSLSPSLSRHLSKLCKAFLCSMESPIRLLGGHDITLNWRHVARESSLLTAPATCGQLTRASRIPGMRPQMNQIGSFHLTTPTFHTISH